MPLLTFLYLFLLMSGEITVTPGKAWASPELVTYAGLNLTAAPIARVNEASIGSRELVASAVRALAPPLNRNLLINGNFDVWQRGGFVNLISLPGTMGVLAGTSQFTADRWLSVNVTSAVNRREITRQSFSTGQSDVPNEPTYFLRYKQLITDAGSTLGQPIEDVRTMAGKRVTLTWWMKSSNYSGTITVQLEQHYGGSPEVTPINVAAASGGTATLIAAAAWTKYTAIFDVPTLTGASLFEDNSLVLRFLLPTGTWIIDFAQVQLEQGDGATSYEYRTYLDEARRCERYFEFHSGVFSDDITHTKPCYYFATRKYRAPTIAFIAVSGTGGAVTALPVGEVGYYQSTANSTVATFTCTADAEIYR